MGLRCPRTRSRRSLTGSSARSLTGNRVRSTRLVYPVMFIDAIFVKIRDGQVANRPIYVAIGVTVDGERDILGLWAGQGGEGAKYWLTVLTEIKNRGVADVCIVCCYVDIVVMPTRARGGLSAAVNELRLSA